MGPATVVVGVTIVFPLIYAFRLSLFRRDSFVGLANIAKAISDPVVMNALVNTLVFTFSSVAFHLVLGMTLAVLLDSVGRGRGAFRILLLLPWMVAPVVTATTWRWILNIQNGVLNHVLVGLNLVAAPIPWLSSVEWAMPSVIMANVWMRTPYVMIMLYAGLQGIPRELYHAAQVDGASAWQEFVYVTIPHLRYIIVLATVLDAVYSFRLFDIAYVLTGGGPVRSTEVLSLLVYKTAFQEFDFNYSSAIAIFVFMVSAVFSLVYVRLLEVKE